MAQNPTWHEAKQLQTDCGGEYLSEEFTIHLRMRGTVCNLTIHDTPEEHGVSKWLNCTLLKHAHAVLCHHSPRWISLAFGQHPLYSDGDPYICATTCSNHAIHHFIPDTPHIHLVLLADICFHPSQATRVTSLAHL